MTDPEELIIEIKEAKASLKRAMNMPCACGGVEWLTKHHCGCDRSVTIIAAKATIQSIIDKV